ncbi:DUF6907 domain-containing protein [Mycobacterium canetti]|uniref:DUF6907 domain-containing protein n=1 Tax=Mycobacterium canetti TaxID=78331 RepID=UPI001CD19FCE|nr:hypothetical protein [Mycobacterium canetti]
MSQHPVNSDQQAAPDHPLGLGRCDHCGRYGWHNTERCPDSERYTCTPWCIDGAGHPCELFLDDQECSGPQLKVALTLERGAPALPLTPEDVCGAPGVTVYASKRWYRFPTITANVFALAGGIDYDLTLTPPEAAELAQALLAAVRLVDGVPEVDR